MIGSCTLQKWSKFSVRRGPLILKLIGLSLSAVRARTAGSLSLASQTRVFKLFLAPPNRLSKSATYLPYPGLQISAASQSRFVASTEAKWPHLDLCPGF